MTRYANADVNAATRTKVTQPKVTLYNYEGNQRAFSAPKRCANWRCLTCSRTQGRARRAARDRAIDADASVPYLVDENTGVSLGESEKIVKYRSRRTGGT